VSVVTVPQAQAATIIGSAIVTARKPTHATSDPEPPDDAEADALVRGCFARIVCQAGTDDWPSEILPAAGDLGALGFSLAMAVSLLGGEGLDRVAGPT